jgi:hypothetical protein
MGQTEGRSVAENLPNLMQAIVAQVGTIADAREMMAGDGIPARIIVTAILSLRLPDELDRKET